MFDHPVAVMVDKHKVIVREVEQARDLLMNDWPSRRGPRHRDALETCLKVLDGHRSTVDAEIRFREAAQEAGIILDRAETELRS